MNCFGTLPPTRVPLPAARMMAMFIRCNIAFIRKRCKKSTAEDEQALSASGSSGMNDARRQKLRRSGKPPLPLLIHHAEQNSFPAESTCRRCSAMSRRKKAHERPFVFSRSGCRSAEVFPCPLFHLNLQEDRGAPLEKALQ